MNLVSRPPSQLPESGSTRTFACKFVGPQPLPRPWFVRMAWVTNALAPLMALPNSRSLRSIVRKTMALDPSLRYTSTKGIAHDLLRFKAQANYLREYP